jgi:anti-sigma B factor antagonist
MPREREETPEFPVFKWTGAMNVDTVRPFAAEVARAIRAGKIELVVDMSELRSLSGGAMGALLLGQSDAERHGGSLKLAAVPESIRKALEASGLEDVFEIYPTTAEAMTAFQVNRRRPRRGPSVP